MAKTAAEPGQDRYMVPGLERGLRLLRLCAAESAGITLGDAAKSLAISRSSAFRILYTLEQLGFVQRSVDERRFHLGPQVMGLRANFTSQLDLGETARPHMEQLRESIGQSVHLAVRDGREIFYTVSLSGRQRVTTNIGVGTRLPAHATSMGRILLSALDDAELRALYKGVRLEAATPHTPASVPRLLAVVRSDAQRGYVVSLGTFDPGIWSVASPIHDSNGSTVAAISCTCPAGSVDATAFSETIRQKVCGTAGQISARLGYLPRPAA